MSDFKIDPGMANFFKTEADRHLLAISNNLLAMEQEGISKEKFTVMKREAHTLKGDARMLGFGKISNAAHKLEDLFEHLVNGDSAIDSSLADKIFTSIDIIQNAVSKLPDEEIEIVIEEFIALKAVAKNTDNDGIEIFGVADTQEVEPSKLEPEKKQETLQQETSQSIEQKNPKQSEKEFDYINLRLKKIDDLINLFSAFPRYANLFSYIYSDMREFRIKLEQVISDDILLKNFDLMLYEFSHELTFLDITTKQFQNELSKIKLVPLATIFDLFPRLVRDMAMSTGKKINFIIKGKEVELDKSVVERVKEMLIHIISNSVDHGCETSEQRVAAGKTSDARVELIAYNKGDSVVIEIKDDGKGIDIEGVRNKAIEKKLIAEEKALSASDDQIINFIFEPGFSTKQLTQYSGRGIGMDVVAKTIKDLNGEIGIESWKGKGSTFRVTLPLLSFFLPTTFVTLGERTYAIPSSHILTTLRISRNDIKNNSATGKTITFDATEVAIIDIHPLFNASDMTDDMYKNMLIIKFLDEVAAVEVNEVLLEKKIVIKKVSSLANRFPLIIGAVLLGNEEAIPVINIPELFKMFKSGNINITKYKKDDASHRIWAKNILVVDDSPITREHEKGILLNHNLNVFEAANGKEALLLLEKTKIDFIISDIEMPVMDGMEFLSHVKKNRAFSSIPIAVVSSYKDYESKVIALGANYFINKFNFKSETLVEILTKEEIL